MFRFALMVHLALCRTSTTSGSKKLTVLTFVLFEGTTLVLLNRMQAENRFLLFFLLGLPEAKDSRLFSMRREPTRG